MEVEVTLRFNRQELWTLLESVPGSQESLLAKLSEARKSIEREPRVYGGGTTIRLKDDA